MRLETTIMNANVQGQTYGYPKDVWEGAKAEAIRAIVRRCAPIFYSDLVTHIRSIGFGPHDSAFHYLLYEISVEEDAAGRGMLSVLVVRKEDGMPGEGFWDLAKQLKRDVSDRTQLWSDETKLVMSHCHNHPLAI
ncbi:MAG: hypothetical protein ABSC33_14730 [Candidatus Sulfotelmatobacter sp.]